MFKKLYNSLHGSVFM